MHKNGSTGSPNKISSDSVANNCNLRDCNLNFRSRATPQTSTALLFLSLVYICFFSPHEQEFCFIHLFTTYPTSLSSSHPFSLYFFLSFSRLAPAMLVFPKSPTHRTPLAQHLYFILQPNNKLPYKSIDGVDFVH